MPTREELLNYPERYNKFITAPCIVTILMVTDHNASFLDFKISFQEVVNTLKMSQMPWLQFNIRLAHRCKDPVPLPEPDPTYEFHFDFTDEALKGVDEVWLFG